MYSIFAICGSTRTDSSNHQLIRAIAALQVEDCRFDIYTRLADIPAFNPDTKEEETPVAVQEFRHKVAESDGVLICTPEYAHGVPGALKNAIDWTVGSCEFSGKPTALITASTDGRLGHAALLETLKVIECSNINNLHLLVQYIKTKINSVPEIIDWPTLAAITLLMKELQATMNDNSPK